MSILEKFLSEVTLTFLFGLLLIFYPYGFGLWSTIYTATFLSIVYWSLRSLKAYKLKKTEERTSYPKNTKSPFVSILIPAWEEEKSIEKCISHILKSDYSFFEVVVIAGGRDRTFDISKEMEEKNDKLSVIKQEMPNKNTALNKGMEITKGELIALVDVDTFVEKNWLRNLVVPIIEKKALATTGNYFSRYKDNWLLSYFHMQKVKNRFIDKSNSLYGGGTIAIDRNALNHLGKFNERISVGVDYYLNRRLAEEKMKTLFVKDAEVTTDLARNLKQYIVTFIRWKRGLLHISLLEKSLLRRFVSIFTFILDGPLFVLGAIFVLLNFSSFQSFYLIWAFFYLYSMLKSINMVFETSIFSGRITWLKYLWVPPLLLLLNYFLTLISLFTSRKFDFKGPRKL